MLAKGNRSKQVTDACKEHGGFYLGSIGGPGARLAQDCIKKVECVEYPELGMEAIWRIEVEDFPAFIVVDDKGNDFFANIRSPPMSVLPDLIEPGLTTMFCGSAASSASARVGAYYAGPGNRFWTVLHETGLTPHLFVPAEFQELLSLGIGLTDLQNMNRHGRRAVIGGIRCRCPACQSGSCCPGDSGFYR